MARRVFNCPAPNAAMIINPETGIPTPIDKRSVVCVQIKHYREKLGMEQQELAKLINVSPAAISNWENGRARPDINLLPDICGALCITLYDLYSIPSPEKLYDEEEKKVVQRYRSLTHGHQRSIRVLMDSLYEEQEEKNEEPNDKQSLSEEPTPSIP